MRKRDTNLREHVRDEARAVEAGRGARPSPDVRDAEVLERDAHDLSIARGWDVRVVRGGVVDLLVDRLLNDLLL